MYAKTRSASVLGISAVAIEIECFIENGLPAFQIVGLPDGAVRESRERVQAALRHAGYELPPKKYSVNLAPADVRKEGSAFDIPIAIGLLIALGQIEKHIEGEVAMLGELAFDGTIRPARGVLPVALTLYAQGVRTLIVPTKNADEAAVVEGLTVLPVDVLTDVVAIVNGEVTVKPHNIDIPAIFRADVTQHHIDMHDVKGQDGVKRALEIAAAGGHNMIMVGPPGAGKTMLAKRLSTILPPLTLPEALETTKIHSVAGLLPPGRAMITQRPFRAPHHTISDAALVGGGVGVIRAGEVSLAHHGVLFLDEVPEFQRNVLEVLRQPLEERCIRLSRTKMTVDYPANVMLVCSMNPCPCGNFTSGLHECKCSPLEVQKYMSKVSGPLLDRIDLHIDVPAVRIEELAKSKAGETSASIRERVVRTRELQQKRFEGVNNVYKNADMGSKEIEKYCALQHESARLLRDAMTKLKLSARAYDRILKMARTIADLANTSEIQTEHIAEAVMYRSLDRPYWNA